METYIDSWDLDPELKPCPLCGRPVSIKCQKVDFGLSGTIIKCFSCQLTLSVSDTFGVVDPLTHKLVNINRPNHRELAIKKWNSRI